MPGNAEADLMEGKRWVVKSDNTLEFVGSVGKEETLVKVPHFGLEPGQELVSTCAMESDSEEAGYKTDQRGDCHIWVVGTNKDGSWSLVFRSSTMIRGTRHTDCARCDLFPDGRMVESFTSELNSSTRPVMPRLPADAAEAAKGWVSKVERDNETYHYRLIPPTKVGRCCLEAVHESPLLASCGISFKTVFTWDTDRGLPETIRSAISYADKRRQRGNMKLGEIKTHDPSWSRQFAADAEKYFAAEAAYLRSFTGLNLNGTPAEIKTVLEKANIDLKAAQQRLERSEFRQPVEDLLAKHDQQAKAILDEVERRKTILGQPAAD